MLFFQGAPFVQPGGASGELRTIDGVPAVAVRVVAMPVPAGSVVPDDGPNYFILAPPTGVALTDNEGQFGEIVENLDFKLLHRLGGKLSGRVKADMKLLGPRTATIIGGKLEDLLEVPVRPDGSFEFGHVPPGSYLVSLYPPSAGIASLPVKVGDTDRSGLELVPLPTHTVKGRIVSKN